MKISSRFSVAIHILALLKMTQRKIPTSVYIGSSVNTNPVVIRKILGMLKDAGLVTVKRGSGGAYLLRSADDITLLHVYKAVITNSDNDLFKKQLEPNYNCLIGANIQAVVEPAMLSAQGAMELELTKVTITDITDRLSRCIEQNKIQPLDMKGRINMKAAIINDYGKQVEIKELPIPTLTEDSVMIEVHAASINPIDNIVKAGYMKEMLPITFPYIMGYDVSGIVTEVGAKVSKFKVGDEVYSRPNQMSAGSISEYNVVKENELAIKPSKLTHEEAASIPLAGLTAFQALTTKGNLQKDQKVLIHAGSGGVGTLAIQIAKHLGAKVAVTTSKSNFELVKNLGADVVIDYKTQNFEEELSDYDLVLDTMGGDILNNSFKILKKGGSIVSIKGQDTEELAKKYGVNFEVFFMWPSGEMLSNLTQLINDGIVKPTIDRSFSLGQAQEAYDYLQAGHAKGKVVIKVK